MLTIFSWNVNGIRAVWNKGLFQTFLATHRPDILCLQETKAMEHESPIDPFDYHEYWHSAKKKGYSGTAIFTKEKPLSVSLGFTDRIMQQYTFADTYGDPAEEGRVITAEYEKFYVVTVYTPNSKGDLTRLSLRQKSWDPAFLAHCKLLEEKKPVIFCGDLNVAHTEDDLARPVENRGEHGFTDEERAGFQSFLDAGFVDTFRMFHQGSGHYSWWTNWGGARARNVGWRIDYILVSTSLSKHVVKAEIHPDILGSDHCPVSVTLDV